MAIEFRLPDIGEGLADGEINKWLVSEGDQVEEDQPLVDCAEEVWAAHWGATDSPPERIRRLDTITRILADLRRQHGVQSCVS